MKNASLLGLIIVTAGFTVFLASFQPQFQQGVQELHPLTAVKPKTAEKPEVLAHGATREFYFLQDQKYQQWCGYLDQSVRDAVAEKVDSDISGGVGYRDDKMVGIFVGTFGESGDWGVLDDYALDNNEQLQSLTRTINDLPERTSVHQFWLIQDGRAVKERSSMTELGTDNPTNGEPAASADEPIQTNALSFPFAALMRDKRSEIFSSGKACVPDLDMRANASQIAKPILDVLSGIPEANKCLADPSAGAFDFNFSQTTLDIGRPSGPAIHFYGTNYDCSCEEGGVQGICLNYLLEPQAEGYRLIFSGKATRLLPMGSSHHEYLDLETDQATSAYYDYISIYEFDGNKYHRPDA